jgi:ferredoxin
MAQPTETILQAALLAHIELPHACRNGTCRACICSLRSGTISYQVEWPGVSSEEREAGLFLPCVATARSNVVVEQPLAIRSSMPNVT